MTSNVSLTAAISAAILCAASPLLAQNVERSAEPSLVFVPQAKPGEPMKANRAGGGRKVTGKVGAPAAKPASAKANPSPNGAASTSETYGDWTVNCGTNKGTKFCTMVQAQINKGTGQRVFAIELRASKDGSNEGTILMPFGLKLETGVIVKVDNEEQKLHFSTCIAEGCLIPVTFPNAAIEAIRKAKTFTVGALSVSDQIITFNISLNGFGTAIERANQFAS